jgi:hypothetical protein
VVFDRAFAQHQFLGNLAVGEPLRCQGCHFFLPTGEVRLSRADRRPLRRGGRRWAEFFYRESVLYGLFERYRLSLRAFIGRPPGGSGVRLVARCSEAGYRAALRSGPRASIRSRKASTRSHIASEEARLYSGRSGSANK